MSYADAASRGPRQSTEESNQLTPPLSAAPPVPEIVHSTASDVQSLIDVDSEHISTVPSDFSSQDIQTSTQNKRRNTEEAEAEARENAKQVKEEARRKAEDAKKIAEKEGRALKKQAGDAVQWTKENRSNPVVVGNVVVVAALVAVFGERVYGRWNREGFSWGFAGICAGVVGAFAAVDLVASRWLLQKYPPKE